MERRNSTEIGDRPDKKKHLTEILLRSESDLKEIEKTRIEKVIAAIVVKNAGCVDANGVYRMDGESNGKPKYLMVNPTESGYAIKWVFASQVWALFSLDKLLYTGNGQNVGEVIWKEHLGELPCPTVSITKNPRKTFSGLKKRKRDGNTNSNKKLKKPRIVDMTEDNEEFESFGKMYQSRSKMDLIKSLPKGTRPYHGVNWNGKEYVSVHQLKTDNGKDLFIGGLFANATDAAIMSDRIIIENLKREEYFHLLNFKP